MEGWEELAGGGVRETGRRLRNVSGGHGCWVAEKT